VAGNVVLWPARSSPGVIAIVLKGSASSFPV
jgi:hypothetical protein